MVRPGPEGENRTVTKVRIARALISVYDKTGLEDLAGTLHRAGVEIVSTGSTAAVIAAAGVPVTKVEDLTGFPECLDGRVKTLHPAVHAGLLADAPQWMKSCGLQWLHRLAMEPRRLARRYFVNNPRFLWSIALQLSGAKRFMLDTAVFDRR